MHQFGDSVAGTGFPAEPLLQQPDEGLRLGELADIRGYWAGRFQVACEPHVPHHDHQFAAG